MSNFYFSAISAPQRTKSAAAPEIACGFLPNGRLDDPAWQSAAVFNDFESLPVKGEALAVNTEVRLMHDEKNLYVGITAFEIPGNIMPIDEPGKLWSGDLVEIYFGNIHEKSWVHQYVVGPGRERWANHGDLNCWDAVSAVYDDRWTVELTFPLEQLRLINHSVKFNVCRQRKKANDYQIWSYICGYWQTIDGYGELIIGTYNEALKAKYSLITDREFSRQEYENLTASKEISRQQLRIPPYLHDLSADAVSIGFQTVGNARTRVLLREKNSSGISELRCNYQNYVWASNRDLHHVRAAGLIPGREYEYQIQSFDHVNNLWQILPEKDHWYNFKMPEKDCRNAKFMIFSDMHGRRDPVAEFMSLPQVKDCDFIVNLGDMTTYTHSAENIFSSYLDAQSSFASGKFLVNIRGNHEFDGLNPGAFFEVFPHHTGKSYFTMRFGDICFIALDGGSHFITPEMHELYAEQNRWLKDAVKAEDFRTAKCRIILTHMPVMDKGGYGTNSALAITDGVFTGDDPAEKVDIMLSGHTHEASITPSGSSAARICGTDREKAVVPVPFPVVCNDGPEGIFKASALLVTKKAEKLTVEVITSDNRVIDKIETISRR